MMWNKRWKLKASFYHMFFALIVIPILLIILVSTAVIRAMMVDCAIRGIKRAQGNIISALGSEVKDVSLCLAHFVYVNDNEMIKIAVKTNTDDYAKRQHSLLQLSESFELVMSPLKDILSAVFYMKAGKAACLKEDITLPEEKIREAPWYQAALSDKNTVKIGFYDRTLTRSRKNVQMLTIAAALSPGSYVDRDGVVEVVALFVSSRVGSLIKEYNKDGLLGTTMLLESNGEPVFDTGSAMRFYTPEIISEKRTEIEHKFHGKRYHYIISQEPLTGLLAVTIADSNLLTREFNRTAAIILAITTALFALFYLFSLYFLKNIIDPVYRAMEGMKKVEEGGLDVHVEPAGQAELRLMIHSFNRMTRCLKQLKQENEKEQQKKHKAQIRALQSQINPHFLVNSLNSIRFIAHVSRYEAIAKMAEALIKILSCSFRSHASFYSLNEELEVLDGFLYLMKIRYSDGFEIDCQIEKSCRKCLVPRLILQPIVENSIVHGFSELDEGMGKINISARLEGRDLCITVRDNGKGMTKGKIRRLLSKPDAGAEDDLSIGVANVNERLILNYGENRSLRIYSEKGSYTETVIRIPAATERGHV